MDHVEAMSQGGAAWAPGNFQSLCKTHHSQKTARSPERGAFVSHRPFNVIGPDGYEIPAGVQPFKEDEEN